MIKGVEENEMTDIKIGKKIGEGSYGRLHEYVSADSKVLAVKIMKKTTQGIDTPLEMSIMKYCSNLHVNTAIDIGMDANHIYIFQDLAECDLAHYLLRKTLRSPNDWYKQLLIGLCYLHEENIVHCDIKPANILIMKDDTVRITDYSHSLLLTKRNNTFNHRVGSQRYSAPEVLAGRSWKKEIDIWSLGATFYEMATKKKFMASSTGKTSDENYLSQIKTRPFAKEEFEDKELICSYMLLLKPEERHSAKDILSFYFDHEVVFEKTISPHIEVRYERDRAQMKRVIEKKTTDRDILKFAVKIHETTSTIPFTLAKAEACFVISSKILKGHASFDKTLSTLIDVLEMEQKICDTLSFFLHK